MTVQIGIPAHGERDWLPRTIDALCQQTHLDFHLTICVNQPASWREDPERAVITDENRETLQWLTDQVPHLPFPVTIIDAVDGEAPEDAVAGVGWARARIFDPICAKGDDLCISLDADTHFPTDYVLTIKESFECFPNALGLAVPYYHQVPADPQQALHLLRYELYMRYYQLSLWRIGSPYAYLPLGSAIAFRASAYRRVGGMPPRDAGEDFYFLQRLRKAGPIMRHVPTCVYPASRPSDRVPFGTGPLLREQSLALQDIRFPFYAQQAFDLIAQSFAAFPRLYREDFPLPVAPWLPKAFNKPGAWARIRANMPTEERFIKASHERLDGLRTLQFLRAYTAAHPVENPEVEINTLLQYYKQPPVSLNFSADALEALNALRDQLVELEADCQRQFMGQWDTRTRW